MKMNWKRIDSNEIRADGKLKADDELYADDKDGKYSEKQGGKLSPTKFYIKKSK